MSEALADGAFGVASVVASVAVLFLVGPVLHPDMDLDGGDRETSQALGTIAVAIATIGLGFRKPRKGARSRVPL